MSVVYLRDWNPSHVIGTCISCNKSVTNATGSTVQGQTWHEVCKTRFRAAEEQRRDAAVRFGTVLKAVCGLVGNHPAIAALVDDLYEPICINDLHEALGRMRRILELMGDFGLKERRDALLIVCSALKSPPFVEMKTPP